VLADTDAAFGWLADHSVSSDLMGVLGFDLGATAALVVASQRSLGAAVTVAAAGVSQPLAEGLPALLDVVGELTCPWLGLYGERGDGVDSADVDRLREAAHASDRVVDVVVYPESEHRFDAAERGGVEPQRVAVVGVHVIDCARLGGEQRVRAARAGEEVGGGQHGDAAEAADHPGGL
jgi:carboxymethylenebutenolidase